MNISVYINIIRVNYQYTEDDAKSIKNRDEQIGKEITGVKINIQNNLLNKKTKRQILKGNKTFKYIIY